MRSPALLGALFFVAACGARSTLRPGEGPSAGSGGSSATTASSAASTAAATGTGGAGPGTGGGVNAVCALLATVDPQIELPWPDADTRARDPLLQVLAQGDVLTLVRRESLKGQNLALASINAARVEPWMVWPPVVHPPTIPTTGGRPAAFVSGIEPGDTFALESRPLFPPGAGCHLRALYGLPVDVAGKPTLQQELSDGTCLGTMLAIATAGDGTHFVATDIPFGDKNGVPARATEIHLFDAAGNTLASPFYACASTSLVGDVLPDATGFVFVQSTGDSLDCSKPVAARSLFLRRFQADKEDSFLVYDGVDDMVFARVLPRNGGTWVLFRESGASAEQQPPGMAIAVGADSPDGVPFAVTEAGAGQMAAAPLAGGFAVAFASTLDPSAPTITLRVYSAAGAQQSETTFSTSQAWLNGDRLTLVASPDGRKILVGWTGDAPDPGNLGSRMFLRRFDCVDTK